MISKKSKYTFLAIGSCYGRDCFFIEGVSRWVLDDDKHKDYKEIIKCVPREVIIKGILLGNKAALAARKYLENQ